MKHQRYLYHIYLLSYIFVSSFQDNQWYLSTYCKFEIALSLAVIYVVCVKKNIFFFTCYLLKFFNLFIFLCLIFALFVVVFLLELFDRHGFDNHAYLSDDISRNRKKSYCLWRFSPFRSLGSSSVVRKKGVVWLNREDLFQEQPCVWCNVKPRHHVRPCQDLRWFRETRWQFPKQSSVTSLGNVSITRGPAKRSSAYRWVFYRLEGDSLLRKTTVDRLDMSR